MHLRWLNIVGCMGIATQLHSSHRILILENQNCTQVTAEKRAEHLWIGSMRLRRLN